jgi:hypothetical protein
MARLGAAGVSGMTQDDAARLCSRMTQQYDGRDDTWSGRGGMTEGMTQGHDGPG